MATDNRVLLRDVYKRQVFGHSHKYVQEERGGILWLNPGSCGPRRFHQEITMMTAEITGGKLQVEKVVIPHEAK